MRAGSEINSIYVQHVKGIKEASISCRIIPNTPSFLVAPNGSGKSSLAKAFDSLNRDRLRLDDADFYDGEAWDDSCLILGFDDNTSLRADGLTNEICKALDVSVIHSELYANMTNRRVGNRVLGSTKISIQSITLYSKIPTDISLEYSIRDQRRQYAGVMRKRFLNLKPLFDTPQFLEKIVESANSFNSTEGERYSAWINEYFKDVEMAAHNVGSMPAVELIERVKPLKDIVDVLNQFEDFSDDSWRYANALQVNRFIEEKRKDIRQHLDYLRYKEAKKDINELLDAVNSSRHSVKARESGGSLVVDFPDWGTASNGELDLMQFAAALAKARASLERESCLLVIDEVFDYLDDANLAVAQYYLSEMMKQFKASRRNLYLLILTHLDPDFMGSYRFKTKHKSYFGTFDKPKIAGFMRALLVDRYRCQKESPNIYDEVSDKYLHYSPDASASASTTEYLEGKGIPSELLQPELFRKAMTRELQLYLKEKDYDVAKVCCGLRIAVEQFAVEHLPTTLSAGFFACHGTDKRLHYAIDSGADVPEVMFLLGVIYNACMHLSQGSGQEYSIARQLSNKGIKAMISSVVKHLEKQEQQLT